MAVDLVDCLVRERGVSVAPQGSCWSRNGGLPVIIDHQEIPNEKTMPVLQLRDPGPG